MLAAIRLYHGAVIAVWSEPVRRFGRADRAWGFWIGWADTELEEHMVGKWKPIAEYVEPNWDNAGDMPPLLFWRKRTGVALGYIRDGELFDAKWVYICDANKATHFSEVSAPDEKVVELDAFRMRDGERQG